MNFLALIQRAVEATQYLYVSAIEKQLVFSSRPTNIEHLSYGRVDLHSIRTIPVHIYALVGHTIRSALLRTQSGYLLSPGARKHVPVYFVANIPLHQLAPSDDEFEYWNKDDLQVGTTVLGVMDYFGFEPDGGPMLHSLDDIGAYFVPSDVSPQGVLMAVRLMHGHLEHRGLLSYEQVSCCD